MKEDIYFDNTSKRLLALMQLSTYLVGRDGHIWVECDTTEDITLVSLLNKGGVNLNNKIYGGILEALDTIDEALKVAGAESLLAMYSPQVQFAGDPGVAHNRIYLTKKGNGGLV